MKPTDRTPPLQPPVQSGLKPVLLTHLNGLDWGLFATVTLAGIDLLWGWTLVNLVYNAYLIIHP